MQNASASAVPTRLEASESSALNIPKTALATLRLWHLCSLDAPSVAACWTAFVAYVAGVQLSWAPLAGMFLAVWIIYMADRLLDARFPASEANDLEERHRFHQRHRAAFIAVLCLATLALAVCVLHLGHAELRLFASLGCLLVAYCVLIHARPEGRHTLPRMPKEFAVGAFFAAAVFIPTIAHAPHLRVALSYLAVSFALVCALNCTYIFEWEHHSTAQAHWSTHLALRHKGLLFSLIIGLCACIYLRLNSLAHAQTGALVCVSSTICFLLLHAYRYRISKLDLRALVDLALLVPLAVVFLIRVVSS